MTDISQPAASDTPFKYLDYYEEDEHSLFAGREDEIQEVLTGVTRGRTYVLYGASGVGKTSLLLAGLFPHWRQRGFHPLRVRVLESPVEELCTALASALQCPALARDKDPHALVEPCAHHPLILVLDQFEEFFLRFKDRPREREEFIAFLGRIYQQESAANVRLVFSLREDAYAHLEELRPALPDLTTHGLRLLPLTAYGTRQAIVRPLLHVGAHYDETFINTLVDQLAAWQFEPFVLQIVCGELYRDVARRGLPVRLTVDDLKRMGGVEGLLRGYSHHLTSGLAAGRLLLVRAVLDGLITPEHTRRTARAEDLLAGPARMGLEETREVLQHIAGMRLLRVEQRPDGTWYELMHERLVGIIEQWLDDDPDFVRFRMTRHLITSLSEDPQWRTNPHWLLSGEQLQERVEPWKERLRLDERETEFLLRSSIRARAESIPYWASRYDEFGAGHTVELLLGLFEHSSPQVRLGVALACARLEDGSGRLVARCLRLAMESPDTRLRRAAADSFARLARPEDAAPLRAALEDPARRGRALEVMADLYEAGHPLQGFPARDRLLARLIQRKRRVARNQRLIQGRAVIGVFMGARNSVLWAITLGLGLIYVLFITAFPQQVTLRWSQEFIQEGLGLVLVCVPFVFMPLGMLIGWRVARRTGIIIALHGHEHWGYPTFRSGTLMLSSVLLSFMALFFIVGMTDAMQQLERQLGLTAPWFLICLTLASSLLSWLLTWGLAALGSHCIPLKARAPSIYFWAYLGSAIIPLAVEMLLARTALWPGTWNPDLASVLGSIAGIVLIVSSFQSFVITCALAMARKQFAGPQPPPRRTGTRLSRATLLLGTLVVVSIGVFLWGPDTIPFRTAKPLGQGLPLDGVVWKVRDTDYFAIQGPGGESFAMSIQGGDVRTQLWLDGTEATDKSILVSSRQQVLAAVTAAPPSRAQGQPPPSPASHVHYHYQLVQEPIQHGEPGDVDGQHWTLVSLPLQQPPPEPGGVNQWQAHLEGKLPPGWKEQGAVVLVHPVLLDVNSMEKGACMGIFGSSDTMPGLMGALVLQNLDDSGTLPPPNAQAERFLEGFRVEPEPGGSWSLEMTVTPSRDTESSLCKPTPGLTNVLESGRNPAERPGGSSWLLVAVKLY